MINIYAQGIDCLGGRVQRFKVHGSAVGDGERGSTVQGSRFSGWGRVIPSLSRDLGESIFRNGVAAHMSETARLSRDASPYHEANSRALGRANPPGEPFPCAIQKRLQKICICSRVGAMAVGWAEMSQLRST